MHIAKLIMDGAIDAEASELMGDDVSLFMHTIKHLRLGGCAFKCEPIYCLFSVCSFFFLVSFALFLFEHTPEMTEFN